MKKIEAIIEREKDGTFSVYCNTEMFSGMGETAETTKADMQKQMNFFKKTATEDGFSYPDILDDDYEIVYKFDTESIELISISL